MVTPVERARSGRAWNVSDIQQFNLIGALGAITDREARLRLADQAVRQGMTVERVRVAVRAHLRGEDPRSGELSALARAVLRADARARAALGDAAGGPSLASACALSRAASRLADTAARLEAEAARRARTSRKSIE